jgi:hypothetical protein
MSNMHGYSDYQGPFATLSAAVAEHDEGEDDEGNPLQAGFWMEGDSLAPPCGTAISTVRHLLVFANVTSKDVLYDLGCGDGRVCLEAYACHSCATVGVEVEVDLVARAQTLIDQLPVSTSSSREGFGVPKPRILAEDLRIVLQRLVTQAKGGQKDLVLREIEPSAPPTPPAPLEEDTVHLPCPTMITLYLLPESIQELKQYFEDLLRHSPPGFRILCNTWGLSHLRPVRTTEIEEKPGGATTSLFLYTRESLRDDNIDAINT